MRFGTKDTGLFSFATKKELPKPGERRALFQQPLHAYGYKDFEGKIEKGYGKGEVKKFDSGKLLINKVTDDGIHFTRADKKAPERFALIRPQGDTSRWLLVNTTPTKPLPFDKIKYTSIAPDKAKEVLKKLAPGSSVQEKIDGAATLTKVLKDRFETVSYRVSKDGKPIVHTERLTQGEPAKAKPEKKQVGSVVTGETYGVRKGKPIPPQELGGLLNSSVYKSVKDQKSRGVDLKNMVYDIERFGGKKITKDVPYEKRVEMMRDVLKALPKDKFHLSQEAKTPEAALKLFDAVKKKGGEGLVVHPPTGKPGKIKFTGDHDVYIRDFIGGKGKHKGSVGGIYYSFTPQGKIVGRVGTGLSDTLRHEMHENPKDYLGRKLKVMAQEKLPSGALRAPRVLALHEDYPTKKEK